MAIELPVVTGPDFNLQYMMEKVRHNDIRLLEGLLDYVAQECHELTQKHEKQIRVRIGDHSRPGFARVFYEV